MRTKATAQEFPDPWAPSIEERVRTIAAAPAHTVAYVYEVPDTSTFRYRVFNMVEALGVDEHDQRDLGDVVHPSRAADPRTADR